MGAWRAGVIGIDESVDLLVERDVGAMIWKMPGTNDEAIRSQTARARSALDRKW